MVNPGDSGMITLLTGQKWHCLSTWQWQGTRRAAEKWCIDPWSPTFDNEDTNWHGWWLLIYVFCCVACGPFLCYIHCNGAYKVQFNVCYAHRLSWASLSIWQTRRGSIGTKISTNTTVNMWNCSVEGKFRTEQQDTAEVIVVHFDIWVFLPSSCVKSIYQLSFLFCLDAMKLQPWSKRRHLLMCVKRLSDVIHCKPSVHRRYIFITFC